MNKIYARGHRASALALAFFMPVSALAGSLASVHCIADHGVVYVMESHAKQYDQLTGALSKQKMRSHGQQYASTMNTQDFLTSVKKSLFSDDDQNVATIHLRDGAYFVLPRSVISRIGGVALPNKCIETDARSMRPYVQMLLDVSQDLCLKTDNVDAAQVIRMYVEKQKMSERTM